MDVLFELFTQLHAWLFEHAVQPVLFQIGLIGYAEDAFAALEYVLYGVIEIFLLLLLLRPLEALWPVEDWRDRRATRVDVLYTVLHRIGFLPLLFFALLWPLMNTIDGALRMHDIVPPNLEDLIPGLSTSPLLAFFTYLVILDLADYWRHRLQHRFHWWWALHSLHHSQRQMSFWADDRNHLLDDLIADVWFAAVALIIGVPPGQFVFIVMLTRFVESLSHANLRLGFGAAGKYLLVSPYYHRIHHGIGVGHEGRHGGCNFATLFPIWDLLFGSAVFLQRMPATGVRDQLQGRDYGRGFIRQQLLGVQRLISAVRLVGRPG